MGLTLWQKKDANTADPGAVPQEPGSAGDPVEPAARPRVVVSPAIEQPVTAASADGTATLAWPELLQRIAGCTRCPLHQNRIQAVPGPTPTTLPTDVTVATSLSVDTHVAVGPRISVP